MDVAFKDVMTLQFLCGLTEVDSLTGDQPAIIIHSLSIDVLGDHKVKALAVAARDLPVEFHAITVQMPERTSVVKAFLSE